MIPETAVLKAINELPTDGSPVSSGDFGRAVARYANMPYDSHIVMNILNKPEYKGLIERHKHGSVKRKCKPPMIARASYTRKVLLSILNSYAYRNPPVFTVGEIADRYAEATGLNLKPKTRESFASYLRYYVSDVVDRSDRIGHWVVKSPPLQAQEAPVSVITETQALTPPPNSNLSDFTTEQIEAELERRKRPLGMHKEQDMAYCVMIHKVPLYEIMPNDRFPLVFRLANGNGGIRWFVDADGFDEHGNQIMFPDADSALAAATKLLS